MPHAGTPPTSCSVGQPCAAQPDSCCGGSANCGAGGERPGQEEAVADATWSSQGGVLTTNLYGLPDREAGLRRAATGSASR
jgi:hypothetical protein